MFINKVAAAVTSSDFNLTTVTGTTDFNLKNVAANVVNYMLIIAAIVAIIFLIYSGILYLTAAGNEANADKGKKGIINSIIGIIIIVLAFVILGVVTSATKNAVGVS